MAGTDRTHLRCPVWCLYFDSAHEGPCITEDDVADEDDHHTTRSCRCSTCQEDARLESLL